LLGFAYLLAKKNYLLPILYVLPYLTEPRSAPVQSAIFLAMLAGTSVTDIVLPALSNPASKTNRAGGFVLTFIGIYLFTSAVFFNLQFTGTAVSTPNRAAFTWVRENTPEESRILVLTGESDTFCDGISEWFPALTGRISPTTVQGKEWLPNFDAALNTQRSLQACLNSNTPLPCIEDITNKNDIEYEYLYIARQSTLKQLCRVTAPTLRGDGLIAMLSTHNGYTPIYQTDEVVIFAREQAAP
jgi:hypothetical protein